MNIISMVNFVVHLKINQLREVVEEIIDVVNDYGTAGSKSELLAALAWIPIQNQLRS